jgi:hypothetical protein
MRPTLRGKRFFLENRSVGGKAIMPIARRDHRFRAVNPGAEAGLQSAARLS